MTGHNMDSPINLGPYSLRSPERLEDLRVGSFFKRRRMAGELPEKPRKDDIYSSTLKGGQQVASTSNGNNHTRGCRRGSVTSRSTSYDSNPALVVSQVVVEEEDTQNNTHSSDQAFSSREIRTEPPDRNEGEKETHEGRSPAKRTPSLIIDTQTTLESTRSDDNSHESFVIELRPDNLNSSRDTTISSIRTSEGLTIFSLRSPNSPQVLKRKKVYPQQLPYNKIMSGIVFVISGIENPRRSRLRDKMIKMGAKYQSHWNRFCTHLICGFKSTVRYREVRAENGRTVRENWIQDCSKERQLLDWRIYKLGKYPYPDSEEEVEVDELD